MKLQKSVIFFCFNFFNFTSTIALYVAIFSKNKLYITIHKSHNNAVYLLQSVKKSNKVCVKFFSSNTTKTKKGIEIRFIHGFNVCRKLPPDDSGNHNKK